MPLNRTTSFSTPTTSSPTARRKTCSSKCWSIGVWTFPCPSNGKTIAGKNVFFVDGNALAACFEPNIGEELVKELAKRKPLRAVFRDSSFDSDSTKINVEQIFKLLSPETEVKSL